jgi:hypothetical protein
VARHPSCFERAGGGLRLEKRAAHAMISGRNGPDQRAEQETWRSALGLAQPAARARPAQRRSQTAFAFRHRITHTPPTMQITTVAWLMQMRRRPRRVEDGVLGA